VAAGNLRASDKVQSQLLAKLSPGSCLGWLPPLSVLLEKVGVCEGEEPAARKAVATAVLLEGEGAREEGVCEGKKPVARKVAACPLVKLSPGNCLGCAVRRPPTLARRQGSGRWERTCQGATPVARKAVAWWWLRSAATVVLLERVAARECEVPVARKAVAWW